jgi:hypothetical protein
LEDITIQDTTMSCTNSYHAPPGLSGFFCSSYMSSVFLSGKKLPNLDHPFKFPEEWQNYPIFY